MFEWVKRIFKFTVFGVKSNFSYPTVFLHAKFPGGQRRLEKLNLQVHLFNAGGRLVDDFVEFKSSLAWIMRYNNPLPGGQYIVQLRAGNHYASGKWLKR